MKNDKLSDQYLINDQIRAREVRIVGDDIEPKVVSLREALRIADEMELDLVEISPNAVPPVCRVVDYSKFIYQLKKKQKEAKAKQVKIDVKEIRFGPQTDDHDYNFKLKHAIGFLQDGDKVKAYVFFKGRSILFKEQGEEIHRYIRACVAEVYGAELADDTTILYGGSCKASNAPELFGKPDIDGGLIGGASLKAPDFKGIIDAWK